MLMILLTSAVLALTASGEDHVCKVTDGHILHTFSGTQEPIKLGCKFNAVRGTVCGKYRVVVTPGLTLTSKGNSHLYTLEKLFIGVSRTDNLLALEGRVSSKTATMYLQGVKSSPYVKKDGYLSISDVYTISSNASQKEITMKEKQGDFTITFRLYDDSHAASSSFSFICHSHTFVPTAFPRQLCGNGTKDEVRTMGKDMGFEGNRAVVSTYNIVNNPGIIQTDRDCISTSRNLVRRCKISRLEAVKLCWPVVYKDMFLRCLTKFDKAASPLKTFSKCVEFACSKFRNANSCYDLSMQLDGCPTLEGITERMSNVCPQS